MKDELSHYLNDHLAGSAGALVLLDKLVTHAVEGEEKAFFAELKQKIENERTLLERLLILGGAEPSSLRQVVGSVAMRVGALKMHSDGLETGDLGRLEMLELLAVGIQGKGLLWAALESLESPPSAWKKFDFSRLEAEAKEQRDSVEGYRLKEVKALFENP